MNQPQQTTSRRTLLQRILLFAAGACGTRLASDNAKAQDAPRSAPGQTTLRYYARSLRRHTAGQQPGRLPVRHGRLHGYCELLDHPNGKKVGELSTTRLGSETPV